jgi:hypothetical protein
MGYQALVAANVGKAFNLLKDLAEEITLNKKAATSFNFTTQTMTEVADTPIVTKAVITDVLKSASDHDSIKKIVMLKTKEVGDITVYDKITHQNQSWVIGPIIASDNFVTVIEMYKEV